MSDLHIFGIRHHGPGSARSLLNALEQLQPGALLIEGPPDADDIIPLALHEDMQPPVALLIYQPDDLKQAAYYPFAEFSPEWQALRYALRNECHVQFMDLPMKHRFALADEAAPDERITSQLLQEKLHFDPIGELAQAAGFSDGESWWEYIVEQRHDSTDLFQGIVEAMTALREETASVFDDPIEAQREAYMRKIIRAVQRKGFERIAVICGAWHTPALAEMPPAKHDNALLKGLPRTKVKATWVPWTNGRLSYFTGYGAGIQSPGWYHHLWTFPDDTTTRWLTRVAHLLREKDLIASSAQVIDAVRLAESLAALRNRPFPSLTELNESSLAVLCHGDEMPMRLISRKLIIGEAVGEVPATTPMVPLQQDFEQTRKRLRIKLEEERKELDIDLRKSNHLEKSHFLHRLSLLGIRWGVPGQSYGIGTFREIWFLQWQPEFSVQLIEASVWGNTLPDAAAAYARHISDSNSTLPPLVELLDHVLFADLPGAIEHLMTRIQSAAAISTDITHLMEALPGLARILRYGNVRQTDASMVQEVVDGIVVRVLVGLPAACISLDDEAAQQMFERMGLVNHALNLLQDEDHRTGWHDTLGQIAAGEKYHGLLRGIAMRILLDSGNLPAIEVTRRMRLALSTVNEPAQAAAWVEGFLSGSGLILLHDAELLSVLDDWVMSLADQSFTAVLPLLRRTFSTFTAPERQRLGERVRQGERSRPRSVPETEQFDSDRAELIMPTLAQLLGIGVEQRNDES
jgi:hypothetical protein